MAGLLLVAAASGAARAAPACRLAADGRALVRVAVGAKASGAVRAAAGELADYLGRMSGAKFEVVAGDGRTGIAVGVAGDFPRLGLAGELNAEGPAGREQYVLRSHGKGVHAVGATEAGVSHAVWDLLYRLGYRHFFPGDLWEVLPRRKELRIAVDVNERPDYVYRRIWYGYGMWDYNKAPLAAWRRHNRAPGAFVLNTGHAYQGIIGRYRAEFAKHREYYGLLGGRRTSTKLCVANAGVRRLVVRYAEDFFERNPRADSVSVDPSDGGGWCECAGCAAVGTPSDRALTLANEVSKMLEAKLPGKYVAMYAYSHHSPPPRIAARERVIISVATAFLKGGRTAEQNVEGWREQGVRQFGIREYYSVLPWDHDLPGRARGSNIEYLRRTIPQFHRMGARFMSAESSDNWGPNGLGYYLANRMLWDTSEAARAEALKADFFEKAFAAARGPMAAFYASIDGSSNPLLSADLVGRMYRRLREASRLSAGDACVRGRIDQLILYTRYVELYRAYSRAAGERRQAAFERLIRHVWRMRKTMMVHAKGIYRTYAARDKRVSIPDEAGIGSPEANNPWKSSVPWARAELDAMVAKGVVANPPAGFGPAAFGRDLVPIDPLKLPSCPPLQDSDRGRGVQVFHTWIANAPAEIELKVTGGLIAHYRDRGDVQVRLFAAPGGKGEGAAVSVARVPPDGVQRTVKLPAARRGLHRLTVSDGMDMTRVVWPAGVARTVEVSLTSSPAGSSRRSAYFYVPRGTKLVGGYSGSSGGTLHDADGREVIELPDGDHFRVPVAAGRAGRLWSFRRCPGTIRLMTVPPYCAADANQLLLPRRVVTADSAR